MLIAATLDWTCPRDGYCNHPGTTCARCAMLYRDALAARIKSMPIRNSPPIKAVPSDAV